MPTPEEIFLNAFAEEIEGLDWGTEQPEMPVLTKLASNLGLLEEDEGEIEMPIFDKLAANVEGASTEAAPEFDLEGMNELEKHAFVKWAEREGLTKEAIVDWLKDKAKGKEWTAAERGLETAKGKKPKTGRLFSKRKAAKGVAAAEKSVASAKGKRIGLGKKMALGGGAALLTAAVAKKLIGGRKKDDKK